MISFILFFVLSQLIIFDAAGFVGLLAELVLLVLGSWLYQKKNR